MVKRLLASISFAAINYADLYIHQKKKNYADLDRIANDVLVKSEIKL